MKRFSFIGVIVAMVLGAGVVWSVGAQFVGGLPEIKTKRCGFITFWSKDRKELVRGILKKRKECRFSKEEIKVLVRFVRDGYQVKEQTQGEFQEFLAETSKQPGTCRRFENLKHIQGWTGYIDARRYYDPKTGNCVVPKM